jgi:hypothetical protein
VGGGNPPSDRGVGMDEGDRHRRAKDEVEAVDFGPALNDWLRQSAVRVARMEMRLDEAALVVMAEGDDNARNG